MKMGIHLKRTDDTEYVMYTGKKSSTLFEHNFVTKESNIYHLHHDNPQELIIVNNFLLSL